MIQSCEKTPQSSTPSTDELLADLISRIESCERTVLRIHPEHFGSGDIYHFRAFTIQLLQTCHELAGHLAAERGRRNG